MKSRAPSSVAEQPLKQWLQRHGDHEGAEVARARLEYMDIDGTARFLRQLQGQVRVRPRVLITSQVSGRWSTTDPPLANLPKPKSACDFDYRTIMVPDYGTYWILFDLSAVEARLSATYAQEIKDLQAFQEGLDVHLSTARDMFYGETITKEDPRRHMAKTTRYNLQYAFDYRGILEAPDLSIFGGREAALAFAKRFLETRSRLTQAKERVFNECIRTKESRTAFGRVRHLTGDKKTMAKDGWSHMISGTVTGMMNRLIPQILSLNSEAKIVLNRHDGVILSFPKALSRASSGDDCQETLRSAQAIVNTPWNVWGYKMSAPAEWQVVECPDDI